MRRALPVALLALAATAATASADVTVKPVSVDVVASRARAAKVRFYLSADRARDAGDANLDGEARLKPRRKRLTARPRIPEAQPPGDYHVIACIKRSCRATAQALRVTAE